MREHGQATSEWVAATLLVALALGVAAAAAPGLGAARAIGRRVVCAIGGGGCRPAAVVRGAAAARMAGDLVASYGAAIAAQVRRLAPGLVYERGMLAIPVDPRSCRSHRCADAPARAGPVAASATGEPVTLFTHVVRSGARTYIQYWEYFPDSTWNGAALALGRRDVAGWHADDWESVQVRVDADGRIRERASAHHGYTGRRVGADLNVNQVAPGLVPRGARGAWSEPTGWVRIARGSHAGYLTGGPHGRRFTPAAAVHLVALETVALPDDYAVMAPWRKRVYAEPEWAAT